MKRQVLIFSFLLFSLFGYAQKSEIGAFIGTSFYLGELNPQKIFAQPKVAGGIIYRYNITPRWAVRANIIFAEVSGSDQQTNKKNPRNLSFTSPITEISAQAELNFLRLYSKAGKNRFTPYIFAGVGLFSFNPRAELNGQTFDLQHLGTEGQGLPDEKKFYSLTNFCIPFGIGFRYNVAKFMCIGIEWGMRFTLTDYLDDVSGNYYDNEVLFNERGHIVAELADRSDPLHEHGTGRGNVTTKDWYSFAGLTITFKIGNEDKTCDIDIKKRANSKFGRKR